MQTFFLFDRRAPARAAVADDDPLGARVLHHDRCGTAAGEDGQRRAEGDENRRGLVALLQGHTFPLFAFFHRAPAALRAISLLPVSSRAF